MIEPEDYQFPHKQEPKQRTLEEVARAAANLDWLEQLPWRPLGIEW